MKHSAKGAVISLFLLSALTFAGTKDLAEYTLRVTIFETRWNQNGYGTSGFGRGNLDDGYSLRGFNYTFECSNPFSATHGDAPYIARWKKPESRLAILTAEVGDSSKTRECELRTTVIDGVYGMQDGHLITYSAEQYQQIIETRNKLAAFKNPTDTDPSHYPLLATILEAQWDKNPTGGMVGSGRGNIKNGTTEFAFNFNALCFAALQAAASGNSFKARWKQEDTDLTVLSQNIVDSSYHTCDLKTATNSNKVYIKTTGGVTAVTQDEFKVWVENSKAAREAAFGMPADKTNAAPGMAPSGKKLSLTNADVISMIGAGISTDIILAKMNASECTFDTSPDGLHQLKTGKVPDVVVLEMIKKDSR